MAPRREPLKTLIAYLLLLAEGTTHSVTLQRWCEDSNYFFNKQSFCKQFSQFRYFLNKKRITQNRNLFISSYLHDDLTGSPCEHLRAVNTQVNVVNLLRRSQGEGTFCFGGSNIAYRHLSIIEGHRHTADEIRTIDYNSMRASS